MSAAQSPSLIHQYSAVYTRLQEGRRELIGFGIDRVMLNRYILDSAESTSQNDPASVLATVSLERVSSGDNADDKLAYCGERLSALISMQEEVNTLQKVAREKGIGAGLLTIVGQASVQSPKDHGASVILQLNQLLNGSEDKPEDSDTPQTAETQSESTDTKEVVSASDEDAANDSATHDFERLSMLQKLIVTVLEHKSSIGVDVAVCFFASCLAIKLVS